VPLDASLVKGSHGRRPDNVLEWPVCISSRSDLLPRQPILSTDVHGVLQRHLNSWKV
jgi:hypothetical protein